MTASARLWLLALVGLAAAITAATPFRPSATRVPATLADTGRPAVTLLYQNFPNPFPTADARATCIWFDLSSTASVDLTVHDVRGNLVRRLLPNGTSPRFLTPGRYGRASETAENGCNPAFVWDGTADDGSTVPRGVYLIRLRAAGIQSIKKAVFQGP